MPRCMRSCRLLASSRCDRAVGSSAGNADRQSTELVVAMHLSPHPPPLSLPFGCCHRQQGNLHLPVEQTPPTAALVACSLLLNSASLAPSPLLSQEMGPEADEAEHSLELHLPYIVHVMRGHPFTLVPIVVGAVSSESGASMGGLGGEAMAGR